MAMANLGEVLHGTEQITASEIKAAGCQAIHSGQTPHRTAASQSSERQAAAPA
jgi:hypothetical protein